MMTLRETGLHISPKAALVAELSRSLAEHPLHTRFRRIQDIWIFTQHHVWCVWDFMSLLKSIQRELAPAAWPWLPKTDVDAARLINEITVGEECDLGPDGRFQSHYAIYVDAMRECGAEVSGILGFQSDLEAGVAWREALARANAPQVSKEFTRTTLEICEASLPERIAAFTLAREEIIPATFRPLIEGLSRDAAQAARVQTLRWYLDRHVSIDGDEHGPMAARLFRSCCMGDEATVVRSLAAATRSLEARLALWNEIAARLAR